MQKITIFSDGASKGNPGPGGWGALVANEETVIELGGREDHTTNNRMELTGALEALTHAPHKDADAVLYTDSRYVINGITKWVKGWEANGWVTQNKKPVLNKDLWEKLVDAVRARSGKIKWEYVGGHVGIAGNERVDEIASNFAEKIPVTLYSGTRAAYTVNVADISLDQVKQKAKSESSARSKLKAYSYVSKVDGTIQVHKTWAECEARVKGKAARFKKATSSAEETQIIQQFS
ncbi:ribonuclease HI [Candidatus Adlerbacteria bacterium RIFOXYC1_FULL_48_26]|uniref:Ribonuclease H n=1 Tax=Candidatus Adlerbacteria bacterium RIFOXYC1_FULL_48_26 TaxID=1797247 RepID=A0A1F4Y3Y8_9BACT|nr:MAG: ribonuclease HI [Candidatus Adlerbacteria bacterium RIFOXYC1_FULL_48_26]OGC93352.1 MAG: ribonuclease HI [Candidatus Adlerbacteria bacterium RIFOXYB1_FULL_48_10]OGC96246.1 MAG: ribonuclease HI [Candidatus Adlerbacteria bacterium RIFOXYD1_FULL_48_8]